jgi:uncharacterized protein YndB with AHSA1/START domain
MVQTHVHAIINAPPEACFELYMDGDRRAEWNPSARGLLEQSGPHNQAGSRYVIDTRFGPFEVHLLRVEPPHLVEMVEAVGQPGESHVTIRFDPLRGGRTRLSAESTFKPHGRLGRLTAPLYAFFGLAYSRIELRRFRAVVERGRAPQTAA